MRDRGARLYIHMHDSAHTYIHMYIHICQYERTRVKLRICAWVRLVCDHALQLYKVLLNFKKMKVSYDINEV